MCGTFEVKDYQTKKCFLTICSLSLTTERSDDTVEILDMLIYTHCAPKISRVENLKKICIQLSPMLY